MRAWSHKSSERSTVSDAGVSVLSPTLPNRLMLVTVSVSVTPAGEADGGGGLARCCV